MTLTQLFCHAVTQHWGEKVTSPNQFSITLSGRELKDFAEYYYLERIRQSRSCFCPGGWVSIIVAITCITSICALFTLLFLLF